MFEKVLVPFDFSADSNYVVQCLKKIPQMREVILLHILYSKCPSNLECGVSPDADYARLRLMELAKNLETRGLQAKAVIEEITGGEIVDVINRVAIREKIPLVLMGRRGQGVIEGLILGSVASDVLRYGKTDLVLVHPPEMGVLSSQDSSCPDFFSNVMICTDFSEPDIMTLSIERLSPVEKVTLLHVVATGASEEEVQALVDAARTKLEKMKDAFLTREIRIKVQVPVGDAAEEIISMSSKEKISMIVLKSTGKKGLLANILGSITGHVARNAQCPVLVLRR